MKRRGTQVPAVPATVALAPDVAAPAKVDEATAAVTTAIAEALADGVVDLDPAPVIDLPASEVSGADAVALATAQARAEAPVEPLIPVPATQALPADQITPELPVGDAIAGATAFASAELRDRDAAIETINSRVGNAGRPEEVRADGRFAVLAARIEAVEARLDALDSITLGLDVEGRVTSADADLPADQLAQLRRDVLGSSVSDDYSPLRARRPERRGFPVEHGVLQDGAMVRPLSRDRVKLTEREHVEALAGGIVTLAWDDGDAIEEEV